MNEKEDDVQQWALEITEEIYSESLHYKWEAGIKIFYSPVTRNPPLVIISYQQGGDKSDYAAEDQPRFEKRDFRPLNNSYCETDHSMSKRVRELLDYERKPELLKSSVVFPIIFFRASSVGEFRNRMGMRRSDAEKFCCSKVREILEKLVPRRILIIGFSTYNLMLREDILAPVEKEEITWRQKIHQRLATTSEFPKYKIFITIHLTGAHPALSSEERRMLKKLFSDWIGRNS